VYRCTLSSRALARAAYTRSAQRVASLLPNRPFQAVYVRVICNAGLELLHQRPLQRTWCPAVVHTCWIEGFSRR
jgi:hypothetical protein